ncbi:glutamine synthetase [Rickettsia endosymbiont of Halotydeus destructor]|uniref:glutamine synthetase n=1 Tax=Rickettsia endosymbiont of Halotydeus destructor TaxID=2996754 RepID=UPI003BB14043
MQISYNEFVSNLANNLQRNKQLEKIITRFQKDYNLIPVIGVEIEFYLSSNIDISKFETLTSKYLAQQKISKIKKERGNNQYEVDLPPSTDLINYINEISKVKLVLENIASELKGDINFSPKPFLNDYGNSMHFHINFIADDNVEDIVVKSALFGYNESRVEPIRIGEPMSNDVDKGRSFDYMIAKSLCHYMLDTFLIFMPNEQDYLRLDKNFMAPTNISFGGNNRTVALRIPDSMPKRLEHRLSSPSTDPYIAIFTILKSILLGFQFPENINDITKIYGNAFDEQYNLISLPKSPEESFKLFKPKFFEED